MKRAILFFMAGFVLTSTAHAKKIPANDEANCKTQVVCQKGDESFSINFVSASGNCYEDDTALVFKSVHQSRTLDLERQWYFPIAAKKKSEAICMSNATPILGNMVTPYQFLFIYSQDHRPTGIILHAVLIDTKTGDILDKTEIGETHRTLSHFVKKDVLKTREGYHVNIIREHGESDDGSRDLYEPAVLSVDAGKIKKEWINTEACP